KAEVVDQRESLGDVVLPAEPLDPAARLAGLAPVKENAGVRRRERGDETEVAVAAEAGPVLQAGVEAAGTEHQQGRTLADHLVSRRDAVRVDDGHADPPGCGCVRGRGARYAGPVLMPPRICRPARTSAAYAVSASKAIWATLA